MVSPRKSRKKSACFSSTTTSTPARASRKPSIIPAGPPPAMQQVVAIVAFGMLALPCGVAEMASPRLAQSFQTETIALLLAGHDHFGKPASTPGSSPRAGFFRIML